MAHPLRIRRGVCAKSAGHCRCTDTRAPSDTSRRPHRSRRGADGSRPASTSRGASVRLVRPTSSASNARPARGPATSATATARLTLTTGVGQRVSSRPYSSAICGQSVSAYVGARAVQAGDRGLHLICARSSASQHGIDQSRGLGDRHHVPSRPVLVGEQHDVACLVGSGAAPGIGGQGQGEQADALRLVGHQFDEHPASRMASSARSRRASSSPRGAW